MPQLKPPSRLSKTQQTFTGRKALEALGRLYAHNPRARAFSTGCISRRSQEPVFVNEPR